MANPIISSNGLGLYRLTNEHVVQFCENISDENKREFEVIYKADPLESLLTVVDTSLSHAVMIDGEVIAVCGMHGDQLWSMFTKKIKKHWRKFVKASPMLINFYHYFHDDIVCEVWAENVFIHNWLLHLGFNTVHMSANEDGQSMVAFVRCNCIQNNVHSKLSRPVIH